MSSHLFTDKTKLPSSKDQLLTDPVKIGPGMWMAIHMLAHAAVTDAAKEAFIAFMEEQRDNFPCKKCRQHINQYLTDHPIRDFYNIKDAQGRDIGMFKYSWMFHNAVNTRLDKPYLDWATVWKMYDNPTITPCTKSCDEDTAISTTATTTATAKPSITAKGPTKPKINPMSIPMQFK